MKLAPSIAPASFCGMCKMPSWRQGHDRSLSSSGQYHTTLQYLEEVTLRGQIKA